MYNIAKSLPVGDVVVVEGRLNAAWQRGRDAWGARGLFPCSCMKELHLSGLSRRLQEAQAAQATELPPNALGMARALMSLHAQLDEELDFREGDLITIVGLPEPGWFLGELDGRSGTFPEGFVELLAPLRTLEDPHDVMQGGDGGQRYDYYQSTQAHRDEDEDEDDEEEDVEIVMQGEREQEQEDEGRDEQQEVEEEEDGVYGVALYDFRALEPGELDFDVGDRIQVVNTLDDGWLEGVLHGQRGIFPHRFIKMEDDGRASLHPETTSDITPMTQIEVVDEYVSEYGSDQQVQNALQQDSEAWEPQEDHTVWDLDYFERREEETGKWMEDSTCATTTTSSSPTSSTSTTTSARERAGTQTTTTAHQTQAGEKPARTRPPPPACSTPPKRKVHLYLSNTLSSKKGVYLGDSTKHTFQNARNAHTYKHTHTHTHTLSLTNSANSQKNEHLHSTYPSTEDLPSRATSKGGVHLLVKAPSLPLIMLSP